MINRSVTEILIGAVVVATAIWFLYYTSTRTNIMANEDSYNLSADFRSVEGVSLGTDVRLAGVKIGIVKALILNPETYRVKAIFSVKNTIRIPDDSQALISTEGLLGGTFLELVPGGSFDYFAPESVIMDTQGSISIITLLMRLGTTSAAD
jgi:phospholipid/cholesterol/gamma-HCH transport system substrate-binding protein